MSADIESGHGALTFDVGGEILWGELVVLLVLEASVAVCCVEGWLWDLRLRCEIDGKRCTK